jgi:leader peptidase (prepilin peptidase)/N-methyltransferase
VAGARDASPRDQAPRLGRESAELTSVEETGDAEARLEPAGVEPSADAEEAGPSGFALIRELPRKYKQAVAAVSVVLAAACFIRFGLSGRAVVGAVFAAVLVLLTATDLHRRLIPNVVVLPATAGLLAAQIALYPDMTLEWILSGLFAALFLFLPLLVFPTGMGMGDVKLAALLGVVLGKSVAAAILLGILTAAVYSVVLLVREGMSARKKTFAYGPFLVFGGLLVLLLGGR